MSDSKGVYYLGFLLVGMGIGAGLALLFAPQSGKDTRKYLARRAEEGADYVTSVGKDLRDKAQEAVGKGRNWAGKLAQ
jgi:gas vesicle protein